jgi:beta-glucanase (GH16 family)
MINLFSISSYIALLATLGNIFSIGNNTYSTEIKSKSYYKTYTEIDSLSNYQLIWSDEFNIDGAPDSNKWIYDIGKGENGWGNNEAQYYTQDKKNIHIEDGLLKIIAIKEDYKGGSFTSSRIKTQGKFDFKYGIIEVRARVPEGKGTWPAAWMLGSNITTVGWPQCGEIDIVEHVGKELNTVYGTLHYPERSGGNADGSKLIIKNATTEFHIYKVDWSESSIRIYVDDKLIHEMKNSPNIPFHHNFFIILNLAMGGNFGGPIDENIQKALYEVDYVRVYQKNK